MLSGAEINYAVRNRIVTACRGDVPEKSREDCVRQVTDKTSGTIERLCDQTARQHDIYAEDCRELLAGFLWQNAQAVRQQIESRGQLELLPVTEEMRRSPLRNGLIFYIESAASDFKAALPASPPPAEETPPKPKREKRTATQEAELPPVPIPPPPPSTPPVPRPTDLPDQPVRPEPLPVRDQREEPKKEEKATHWLLWIGGAVITAGGAAFAHWLRRLLKENASLQQQMDVLSSETGQLRRERDFLTGDGGRLAVLQRQITNLEVGRKVQMADIASLFGHLAGTEGGGPSPSAGTAAPSADSGTSATVQVELPAGSVQRRPPAVVVPEPPAPLPPFGMAGAVAIETPDLSEASMCSQSFWGWLRDARMLEQADRGETVALSAVDLEPFRESLASGSFSLVDLAHTAAYRMADKISVNATPETVAEQLVQGFDISPLGSRQRASAILETWNLLGNVRAWWVQADMEAGVATYNNRLLPLSFLAIQLDRKWIRNEDVAEFLGTQRWFQNLSKERQGRGLFILTAALNVTPMERRSAFLDAKGALTPKFAEEARRFMLENPRGISVRPKPPRGGGAAGGTVPSGGNGPGESTPPNLRLHRRAVTLEKLGGVAPLAMILGAAATAEHKGWINAGQSRFFHSSLTGAFFAADAGFAVTLLGGGPGAILGGSAASLAADRTGLPWLRRGTLGNKYASIGGGLGGFSASLKVASRFAPYRNFHAATAAGTQHSYHTVVSKIGEAGAVIEEGLAGALRSFTTGVRLYGREVVSVASGYAAALQTGAQFFLNTASRLTTPIFLIGDPQNYLGQNNQI